MTFRASKAKHPSYKHAALASRLGGPSASLLSGSPRRERAVGRAAGTPATAAEFPCMHVPMPLRNERAYKYRIIAARLTDDLSESRFEPEVLMRIKQARDALVEAADLIQHVRHLVADAISKEAS